jgi:hypothetical protein
MKELENVEVEFGLRQQGHIPTVEQMRNEGKSFNIIAKKIGWTTDALTKHWAWELERRLGIGNSPKPEELDEFEGKIRLFLIGNEIPVISNTNNKKAIRQDVSSEDHGGMDYEEFQETAQYGDIIQIKKLEELPVSLYHTYAYVSGSIDDSFWQITLKEFCENLDEQGNFLRI